MQKAFYVISQQAVKRQIGLWNKYIPYVQPYYAVKSNPDRNILKWLQQAGYGFDCASPREIKEIKSMFSKSSQNGTYNGYKDKIIYANPHKSDNDIHEVKQLDIRTTVIDSIEGIQSLEQNNYNANIFVRIAVDDSESNSPFSVKFGAHEQDWFNIIDYLYKNPYKRKNKLIGVSFHVGSGSQNPIQYKKAIDSSRKFANMYHLGCSKLPLKLDIGGGFLSDELNFSKAASHIQSALSNWKDDNSSTYPSEIIAEPGRFFSSPSHTLFVPIIHKKKTPHGYSYIIDESIYGQFSAIPFDHAKPYWISNTSQSKQTTETTKGIIFGRTCDSIDMIAYSDKMPIMNKGDYLCFPNMGAYTRVSASEFNGFPSPNLVYDDSTNSVTNMLLNNANIIDEKDVIFPIETVSKVSLSNNI